MKSQSPQTGQVYFNKKVSFSPEDEKEINVSIPSNGSSLFQLALDEAGLPNNWVMSQSPQTGQVYFNLVIATAILRIAQSSLNPLKRVKFISIKMENTNIFTEEEVRVSIPSNGSSLFQY